MFRDRIDDGDLTVIVSEMLVASADASDVLLDGAVEQVLRRLRAQLGMDAVFVSEFVESRRVFRFVDRSASTAPIETGSSEDLESTFCKRVVDGRLPEFIADVRALGAQAPRTAVRVGTHLSTPVVLKDGRVYGTLCCFSAEPSPAVHERDLTTLRQCARLVAKKLDLGGPPFVETQAG